MSDISSLEQLSVCLLPGLSASLSVCPCSAFCDQGLGGPGTGTRQREIQAQSKRNPSAPIVGRTAAQTTLDILTTPRRRSPRNVVFACVFISFGSFRSSVASLLGMILQIVEKHPEINKNK